MFQKFHYAVMCLYGVLATAACGLAAESSNQVTVLAPFVNNDTVGALYVDVGSMPAAGSAGELLKVLPKGSVDTQSVMLGAMMIDGMVHRFQQAGGQGIYVVAGLADISVDGGPIGVATTKPGQRAEDVERLFRDLVREIGSISPQGSIGQIDVLRKGDAVLVGKKVTVTRYAALKSSPRMDLVEPLAKLIGDGAIAAGVFCPGPDYRRVSRELWPELPGVLAPLKGEMADRWLRFEAVVDRPPNAKPRITLVAKDADAAEIFAKLWRDLPIATTQFGGNPKSVELAKGYAQLLVDSLPVKVEGATATIELPTDEKQISKLRSMITAAADKSMEVSRRKERMNQFKQLGIAMQNYHDENKHFPPAAISDKDGKPLLSWRVAILPHIDELDLYKQFHLDESWDSPHNRALIEKMPAIYADPGTANTGKTTFQVPVGRETAFHDHVGTSFREMKDGSSNTVLIVEVEPNRSVEWTKPADWEVDLAHPRRGLERSDRDVVTLGFADAHVQIVDPRKIGDDRLRAFITPAGGEVIEQQ